VSISLENLLGVLLQLCQEKNCTLSRLKCLSGQDSVISLETSGLRATGYVCVCVCVYVCVCMYIYIYAYVLCMHVCTSECIYSNVYTYVWYFYVFMYACLCSGWINA